MTELTLKRIAEASLAVADEQGASGFTMRAVADHLGVTPMALYHHVTDKAGLVAVLVDEAIAERPLPAPTGIWQDDLWEVARWMRESTLAHPAVGRLRSAYHVWTRSIFPMTERWASVWQQSGLGFEAAFLAASMSATAVIGFVTEELNLAETKPPDESMLSSFPNARFAFDLKRDMALEFELVVRSLIEGLHSRLSRGEVPPSPPSGFAPESGRPERTEVGSAPRRRASRRTEEAIRR